MRYPHYVLSWKDLKGFGEKCGGHVYTNLDNVLAKVQELQMDIDIVEIKLIKRENLLRYQRDHNLQWKIK